MAVINDLSSDQRIHRIASSLQASGWKVLVVGRRLPHSLPLLPRSYGTKRMKLWFQRGKWFYLEYNVRLFLLLLFRKVHLINANDLDTLLACTLISKVKQIPLIYDAHELFTEVPELIHRPRTQHIWLKIEQWLIPKVHAAYTVNESLSQIYYQRYRIPFSVVRNLPSKRVIPNTTIKKNTLRRRLIYQGSLNVGRGLELMIESMAHLEGYELWIVGRGDIESQLKNTLKHISFADRIDLIGFVPFEKLPELTVQAHLGLSLEEDMGANYRFASPNKLFDYIQAGIPVLVSDLPEMRKLVQQHRVGEVLINEERTSSKLADKIRSICENEEKYSDYKRQCEKAAEELHWEKESLSLLSIYEQFTFGENKKNQ